MHHSRPQPGRDGRQHYHQITNCSGFGLSRQSTRALPVRVAFTKSLAGWSLNCRILSTLFIKMCLIESRPSHFLNATYFEVILVYSAALFSKTRTCILVWSTPKQRVVPHATRNNSISDETSLTVIFCWVSLFLLSSLLINLCACWRPADWKKIRHPIAVINTRHTNILCLNRLFCGIGMRRIPLFNLTNLLFLRNVQLNSKRPIAIATYKVIKAYNTKVPVAFINVRAP